MAPKVSIILPAYNVANELPRSLCSLKKQTFKEFEVIVVNDGSVDTTLEVFNSLSLDSRFSIYTIDNHGTGYARNYGLKLSRGQYIYFMDPDDEIKRDLLKDNIQYLDTYNSDFTIFGYTEINLKSKDTIDYIPQKDFFLETPHEIKEQLLSLYYETSIFAVWNKVYRKSFLQKNNLKFEYLPVGQDADFNLKAFNSCKRINIISKGYYNYYANQAGSVTSSYKPYRFNSEKAVLETMLTTIGSWKKKYNTKRIISNYSVDIVSYELKNSPNKIEDVITDESNKNLLNNIKRLKIHNIDGFKRKARFILIKMATLLYKTQKFNAT